MLQLTSNWKSLWFVKNSDYKKFLYEDIFIRKYITSFFYKWSKLNQNKILGSIYIFRTSGKLYLNIFYFHSAKKSVLKNFRTKSISKKNFNFRNTELKPLTKYKKQLVILLLFFNLEKILNTQIYFKYTNICNTLKVRCISLSLIVQVTNLLQNKFAYFKFQFSESVYLNTFLLLTNLLKFKNPDSFLLANFIASVFPKFHKHSRFLFFLKKILQTLQKIFKFIGVRILVSGKLNGFSRAQSKQIQVGRVSLQTISHPFVYGYADSFTRAGKIGIKVWVS